MTMKTCNKCGRELNLEMFNRCGRAKDGRVGVCKSCVSEYNRQRYRKVRDEARARAKEYERDHPDRILESRLKRHESNPSKRNAQRIVEYAIKAGVLVNPQVCSKCGATAPEKRIEAHHDDYAKPLEVEWMCTACHRRADAARRAAEGLEPYGNYMHHDKRKLTREQVLEIRGGGTLASLAEKFGVSIGTVQKVRDGKTYKDVR